MQALRWDLFCRVIDNFGDVGVSWRLAAALARRGQAVRLWIDQPQALAWMAPHGTPGVELLCWSAERAHQTPSAHGPGDVVVETFGCSPPADFVARMAASPRRPVWINLEYLSAEPYVERSHGLPSPQFSGPGAGLSKWFFYPGFTPATGGLLHDCSAPGPADASRQIEARGWARQRGWAGVGAEQSVLVFCYDNPALPGLLQALAPRPTLLLLAPGAARDQLQALTLPPGLRTLALPYLSQPDFDRLLAGTDLNLVRGEDSFARAQLCSACPFLWQIYPQHDGAHGPKLEAFLDLYLAGSPAPLAQAVRTAFRAFNGLASTHEPGPVVLPERGPWRQIHAAWRAGLLAQNDLCRQLQDFVAARLP